MSSAPQKTILLVDDEAFAIQTARVLLNANGFERILTASRGREALELVELTAELSLIILDLNMPGLSGEQVLEMLQKERPEIPVIILSAADELARAVSCMRAGAFDYIVKPAEEERLVMAVRRALEVSDLKGENQRLRQRLLQMRKRSFKLAQPEAFARIVSDSAVMHRICAYLETIAGSSHPVLITGETGTGKELIAEALHLASRRTGRFLACNVAGLDDTAFSDTLFGHVKGAYTGAEQSRGGLIENAAKGSLLLDEIGELNAAAQLKLLRLLQQEEFFPLGSDTPRRSDVRFIAATNLDVRELSAGGKFRRDLFYRLCSHHVHLPPLRERKEDIPVLVAHFLDIEAQKSNKPIPRVPKELMTLLNAYFFPGNIRELQGMVRDGFHRAENGSLSLEPFVQAVERTRSEQTPSAGVSQPSSDGGGFPTLKAVQKYWISEALARAEGNQGIAAKLLGISRTALNKRIKRIGEPGSREG